MSKICNGCNQIKSNFSISKNNKSGLQSRCKDCVKIYDKNRYRNCEKFQKQAREWKANQRILLKKIVVNYLNTHPCIDCSESDIVVLDFDHVRGTKLNNISSLIQCASSEGRFLQEIEKCDIRCANCHRKRTAKNGNWFKLIK